MISLFVIAASLSNRHSFGSFSCDGFLLRTTDEIVPPAPLISTFGVLLSLPGAFLLGGEVVASQQLCCTRPEWLEGKHGQKHTPKRPAKQDFFGTFLELPKCHSK
jgi:hypothetical protein